MTLKEQQLEIAKTEIEGILHNVRCAYINGMALRNLYAEKEKQFLFSLSEHSAPDVFRISNCASHMLGLSESHLGKGFGTLKILLDLSENSTEFKEAYALIQPKMDRVAELEAGIRTETETASRALHALNEAEEVARAAAEAKLANDPAVIAARKALEAAQPALVAEKAPDPPLVRGRQKLESVPA